MQIDLAGKTAVVTGATRQLGRVISRTLAQCGADVAIHYLTNRVRAEELVAQIEAMGRRACAVCAEVADLPSVLTMRDAIARHMPAPDILVNTAVVQYQWLSVLEQAPEDYEGQFRSCVLHVVNTAKAFVPGMITKGAGRIVALSTECAMLGLPNQSAYVSGKRGMDGVLRVLAREVGEHGITVNQVAPGWTISDADRDAGAERQPAYEDRLPLRRRGTDQEIANVVAFLASDLASYITGAYIPVCGGNAMSAI